MVVVGGEVFRSASLVYLIYVLRLCFGLCSPNEKYKKTRDSIIFSRLLNGKLKLCESKLNCPIGRSTMIEKNLTGFSTSSRC